MKVRVITEGAAWEKTKGRAVGGVQTTINSQPWPAQGMQGKEEEAAYLVGWVHMKTLEHSTKKVFFPLDGKP